MEASKEAPKVSRKLLVRRTARIFICYRRSDSAAAAAHLRASLRRRFGAAAVFRDEDSIEPGEDFPLAIEREIRHATVVLVLIGKRWLSRLQALGTLGDPLRLDHVRREIEIALEAKRNIIPVLVDGASMPDASKLPAPIAALSSRDAVILRWHESVAELGGRILTLEREMVSNFRVDLGLGNSTEASRAKSAAIYAMEISLRNQGHKTYALDGEDLSLALARIAEVKYFKGVMFRDLIYVLDLVGVKAKKGAERYVARSRAIVDLNDIPPLLQCRTPVLAGFNVKRSWIETPATTTGVLEGGVGEPTVGGSLGVITDWNPRTLMFTIDTRRSVVGRAGVLELSFNAVADSVDRTEVRAIEAALLPVPLSLKAQRDLASIQPRYPRKPQRTT